MTNTRQAGKRYEREIANQLKNIFPNIRRNAGTQSQSGGVDLENTGCFNIEIKGGKQCVIKKIDKWREQLRNEGKPENYGLLFVRPSREKGYVILEIDDFLELLEKMKVNDII